jgi:hypothetical protein
VSAWGEVVEAGAGRNGPATKCTCLVTIGDEAAAGKIEWSEGICLPTAASALHLVIIWGGMCTRDAADGGKACW